MFALASHENGEPVTGESPARRGEVVTLWGTGFGPLERTLPDGFAVPESLSVALADPLEILAGDLVLTPEWSGAATGFVGTTVTRVRIGDELPAASTVELRVRVNGRESNKVLLPIE